MEYMRVRHELDELYGRILEIICKEDENEKRIYDDSLFIGIDEIVEWATDDMSNDPPLNLSEGAMRCKIAIDYARDFIDEFLDEEDKLYCLNYINDLTKFDLADYTNKEIKDLARECFDTIEETGNWDCETAVYKVWKSVHSENSYINVPEFLNELYYEFATRFGLHKSYQSYLREFITIKGEV